MGARPKTYVPSLCVPCNLLTFARLGYLGTDSARYCAGRRCCETYGSMRVGTFLCYVMRPRLTGCLSMSLADIGAEPQTGCAENVPLVNRCGTVSGLTLHVSP